MKKSKQRERSLGGGGANQNRRLIEGCCIWLQRLLTAKEQSQGGEWELCAFQQARTHQVQKIPLHTLYKSTSWRSSSPDQEQHIGKTGKKFK